VENKKNIGGDYSNVLEWAGLVFLWIEIESEIHDLVENSAKPAFGKRLDNRRIRKIKENIETIVKKFLGQQFQNPPDDIRNTLNKELKNHVIKSVKSEDRLRIKLEEYPLPEDEKEKYLAKIIDFYYDNKDLHENEDDRWIAITHYLNNTYENDDSKNQLLGKTKLKNINNLNQITLEYKKKEDEKDRKKSKDKKIKNVISIVLTIFISIFISLLVISSVKSCIINDSEIIDFDRYVEETPQLVFREISFIKFLVYGKPKKTAKEYEKLDIYQVKGTASVMLDLSAVEVLSKDVVAGTIKLKVSDDDIINMDINIKQEDVNLVEVVEEVEISKETKDMISEIGGAVGAVVAGWAGAKLGDSAGTLVGSAFGPIGGIIGKLSGAALGGIGGGVGGYVATKEFIRRGIDNIDLESSTFGDREKILTLGKEIIALQLLSEGVSEESVDMKKVKDFYMEEAFQRLKELFMDLGWKTVVIQEGDF